jgi:hypothetical protein
MTLHLKPQAAALMNYVNLEKEVAEVANAQVL